MYKAMTMLSATAALALPTSLSAPALCDGGFNARFTTPDGILTLKAVANGTNSGLVLIGQSTTLPGSVITVNGTSPKASLSFEINGEKYGWVVGDVGHVADVANPVRAEKNYEEFQFTVTDDGAIFHQPTAATNVWLACDRTVNGEEHVVLAWGNMGGDGGFPQGCGYTSVHQSCIDNIAPTYTE